MAVARTLRYGRIMCVLVMRIGAAMLMRMLMLVLVRMLDLAMGMPVFMPFGEMQCDAHCHQ